MATYYVYSAAGGAGTGANWANAFTTLAAAFTGRAAGDVFYVADDHAETQASAMTLDSPATQTSPCEAICVSRTGSVPPVAADLRTTATITTTGANSITFAIDYVTYRGINFSAGSGAVASGIIILGSAGFVRFVDCSLSMPGTTGSATKLNTGASVLLLNTSISFGAATDGITTGSEFIWRSGSLAGTVLTTGLFVSGNNSIIQCDGVDLSLLAGSSTIFRAPASTYKLVSELNGCKIGASVTVSATPTVAAVVGGAVTVVRSDSGATNYRVEKYAYSGTLTTETTVIRTGGASDGTTGFSWKLTTTANVRRFSAFEFMPITIWNDTSGSSVTVTIEMRGAAVPNNDEAWMDVWYHGSSASPILSRATTEAVALDTSAACTTSTEAWGGGTSSFKLVKTITPQMKGPITCYVKVAKVSSTFYVDPMITLT